MITESSKSNTISELNDIDNTNKNDESLLQYDTSISKYKHIQPGILDVDKVDGKDASDFADTTLSNVSDSDVLNKVKNVDGSGSGLDADLLDGHDSSDFSSSTHNHNLSSLSDVDDTNKGDNKFLKFNFTSGNHEYVDINENKVLSDSTDTTPDYLGNKIDTNTLDLDVSNHVIKVKDSVFVKTVDNTFDNLSNKTSGTGEYSTSGNLTSGRGSGGVSLTINDGYGNANVTFNHKSGTPEQNGNAGRIIVNTDATTGAYMLFQLKSGVTSGTAVGLTNILKLTETTITFLGYTVWHAGNDGSSSGLNADLLDGQEGSYYQNADNLNAGTVSRARLGALWRDTTSNLYTYPYLQSGRANTVSNGGSISYDYAFTNTPRIVIAVEKQGYNTDMALVDNVTTTGFTVFTARALSAGTFPSVILHWLAIGQKT